jgi:glycine/D-amino acid oxidase-like deaminating enzyme
MERKNIVICGAGIAGISTAYQLAVVYGIKDIVIVDERPPLTLTSDKSTECYRNWWPGPGTAMVSLMNRSIDLLEDLARKNNNAFHLNRRGYLFLTGNEDNVQGMLNKARETSSLGAGELRIHQGKVGDPPYQAPAAQGFTKSPGGADLILDPSLIRKHYPQVTKKTVAGLHIRRAGWLSAQQFGSLLLEKARLHGVQLLEDRVESIDIVGKRVAGVNLESGEFIETPHFVNAAGPYIKSLSSTFGVDLPVFCELHLKVSVSDHLKIIPRGAPMLIWNDPQKLPWTEAEREFIIEDPESHWLLEDFPPGVHARPEGLGDSQIVLMLWEYQTLKVDPIWPPPLQEEYPDVVLRGLAGLLPGLKAYFERPPQPFMDGGYYTKTRENRPLIGPLPTEGVWIIGALSGFGIMASMAAGELLTKHILGEPLPNYAPAFALARYQDPEYNKMIDQLDDFGQL